MKKTQRFLWIPLTLCIMFSLASCALSKTETEIHLSDDTVTVNSKTITQDDTQAVSLVAKTETHKDVPSELTELENRVVTIRKGGTYRVSGTASDIQLSVQAGSEDSVTVILDGVDITCRTAPAIWVASAKETDTVGQAGVTLTLAKDSHNTVNGSHTAKQSDDDVKYDGAVSSAVSLAIDGEGSLDVIADNEGIEVKNKHLTINGGTIHIDSCDDPINASEDGVAHITINDGWIFCSSARGKEGDGIDSNGYITINGGTVIALANPNSMDSGLDSDCGTVINGGTVVGAGNMYDPLENDGNQLFMFLEFADPTDDTVCITDQNGTAIFAYDFPYSYSYISLSSPQLTENTYRVFLGGELVGTQTDGLYSEITSYSGGTAMYHGGIANTPPDAERPDAMQEPPNGMERPAGMQEPPGGMDRPDGMQDPPGGMERPDDTQKPPGGMERPEGMQEPSDGMGEPPHGGHRPGGMESDVETPTADFVLTHERTGFTHVTSQISES